MPSIILHNPACDTEVRISPLSKDEVAQKIAVHFDGFSTDGETTSIVTNDTDGVHMLTVVLHNENGDDGSDPDHDLTHVLDFNYENMKWALQHLEVQDPNLEELGVL